MPEYRRYLRPLERFTRTDLRYLAGAGFWSTGSVVFISAASFLLYVVFGHFLPKETYGTYQYLLSISSVIGAFTLTGMNSAVVRAIAQGNGGAVRRAMQIQVKWSGIPFAVACCLGGYYFLMGNPVFGWGLLLIAVFIPINSALNTYSAVLQGNKDFKRGFTYGLVANVPYYVLVGLVAIASKAVLVLLFANLASQMAGLYLAYRKTLKAYPAEGSRSGDTVRYGAHLSVMGLLGALAAQADTLLAFHYLGAVELALYSFATAIPDRIATLFKFIPSAALPKLADRKPRDVRPTLVRRLGIALFALSITAVAYATIAQVFFQVFFPAYLDAIPYSRLYAVSIVFSLYTFFSAALTASGNTRTLYVFTIASQVAQISFEYAGLVMGGLNGLIVGKVIAGAFALLLGAILYWSIDRPGPTGASGQSRRGPGGQ